MHIAVILMYRKLVMLFGQTPLKKKKKSSQSVQLSSSNFLMKAPQPPYKSVSQEEIDDLLWKVAICHNRLHSPLNKQPLADDVK